LLSLQQALGHTPYKNVKTLRRAYEAGDLKVYQAAPGARITVDLEELTRWLCRPRAARGEAKGSAGRSGRVSAMADRSPAKRTPPDPSREPLGVPPRLSLRELAA
jgi:hypothetical protein